MSTLWIVVIGVLTSYLAYNLYARRIDRSVIQADAKRATPAKMYMDGVDFMPTSTWPSTSVSQPSGNGRRTW